VIIEILCVQRGNEKKGGEEAEGGEGAPLFLYIEKGGRKDARPSNRKIDKKNRLTRLDTHPV